MRNVPLPPLPGADRFCVTVDRADGPVDVRVVGVREKYLPTEERRATLNITGNVERLMTTIREMAGQRGQMKLGTFLVEFATPGIGYILKQAGCDFVLFDLEHSGITLDQLKSALRYLEAAELPAIVGLPSKDPYQVSLALDMGARSIMSPMVETVEEVQQYLARARYAPVGQRAVALRVRTTSLRHAPCRICSARPTRKSSTSPRSRRRSEPRTSTRSQTYQASTDFGSAMST